MVKLIGRITTYPARAALGWYLGTIAIGSMLLTLPMSRRSGADPITWLDALFTATSATCVTGLAVRSTEADFSFLGQCVILLLIQLGGLGIMTVTTFVLFGLGSRESLRRRAVLRDTLGNHTEPDLRGILGQVFLITLVAESTGAVILFVRAVFDYSPPAAAWWAVFHSVSAFCNAGFALHDESLVGYQGDLTVNLTIGVLVIVGGLGYPVIMDLRRSCSSQTMGFWHRLQLHSKLMLVGTAALLLGGMLAFLLLEWDNQATIGGLPLQEKLLVAWFQSMAARTAGFNTVDISYLTNATLFITILLMMIGAGPCSTGGGFKVSTFMVLVTRAWSTFFGRSRINVFGRSIPETSVDRAISAAAVFSAVATLALTTLLVFEQSMHAHAEAPEMFLDGAFEVISALGTVGLSTGFTGQLTQAGRIIIIILMFTGRLGPISVMMAVSRRPGRKTLQYPSEEPLIG